MAVKLFQRHVADRVVILHVVMLEKQSVANYIKTGGDPNIVDDVNEELEEEGKQLLLEYKQLCEKKGVPCEIIEEKSQSPMHRIVEKVTELNAELLVMGSTGKSGLQKLVLG